jgi:hypothetical protein
MSKLREGYGMHLHEGCNLFAVEQGFKNVAGIEHRSYTPIYHDALDRHGVSTLSKGTICASWTIAEALLETGVAEGRRRELKAL